MKIENIDFSIFNKAIIKTHHVMAKKPITLLVYTVKKNIAQVFILERYFFVSICPAAGPGTCLAVF